MTLLWALTLVLASSLCHRTKAAWHPCDKSFSVSDIAMARNITHCRRLPTLGAEIGMSNYNTTPNSTIEVVFSAKIPTPGGWIAWGVNPRRHPQMVGTRALIAFKQTSGIPAVNTYNVTADTRRGCNLEPSSPIEVRVAKTEAKYSVETGRLTMAARLTLPPEYNVSKLNHVWQVGPGVLGMVPLPHPKTLHNFDSVETIDVDSGVGHSERQRNMGLRDAHGILSVIGWGILLPIGVIVSRYFRGSPIETDMTWFYVHVAIQIAAFSLGVTAWGIGLSLFEQSKGYKSFVGHRIIGILIFCLATLQMMALWLKPRKSDTYREYWNIYHHFVGYSLIILIIVNIFKGFAILKPSPAWKWAYTGILIGISCVALVLEISIWVVFQYHKSKEKKNAASKDGSK